LHELLTYLAQRDTLMFIVVPQHGFIGQLEQSIDVSYLADTVILTRYFEAAGSVHNAISIMKQRNAQHEKTIREFKLSEHGLEVGAPLTRFHGVLGGTPEYRGAGDDLFAGSE
jgi:circadian clock protein KaiC